MLPIDCGAKARAKVDLCHSANTKNIFPWSGVREILASDKRRRSSELKKYTGGNRVSDIHLSNYMFTVRRSFYTSVKTAKAATSRWVGAG